MGDALHVLGALVLESGERWGAIAAPFQVADARAILEPGPTDPPLHFLTRPRGGSKTSDLAGVAIAAVLEQFGPADQGYAVAADADQAALLIDAAGGFLQRTPELQGLLTVERKRLVTPTGAAVNVLPADGPSAFGLRGPLFIVDEIAQWGSTPEPRRVWEAVVSAVPKRRGARLVVLTTAGDPGHWSRKVLDRALVSDGWRVHEVPGPVPWIAPEALDEQRALLLPSQYARLHLNQWVAAEDRLTSADEVRACVTHSGVLEPARGVRYVIGVDIGVKRDATAIAVAHAEGDAAGARVVVDQVRAFVPSPGNPVDLAVVEATVGELVRSYNGARCVFDPHQAALMTQNLRKRGVRLSEYVFSQSSISRLALNLHRLLRDHRIGLPDDPDLLDELAAVELRETSPGVYRVDHSRNAHDDRAIAVGLAALELVSQRARRRFTVASPSGDAWSSQWRMTGS